MGFMSEDIFDRIGDKIDSSSNETYDTQPFYMFEPWDVEKRADWIRELAIEDGCDIYDPELTRHIGLDPHPFQSGYMLSTAFQRINLAGNQVGKSYCPLMEAMVMASAEIPYSMRYEKGHDTGIKRVISEENIKRFGRRDAITGTLIDFNYKAKLDAVAWDCGTVKGIGVYPREKIAPEGSQIWIGTFQKAFKNFWWPRLADNKLIIPEHMIDKKKGNKGYHKQDNTVHLVRNVDIVCITYDSGYERFEAEKAWHVILDEEAPDKKIYDSSQQHAHYLSTVFTPYNGITWSQDILFPKGKRSKNIDLFHATQYDSPYQSREEIDIKRETMDLWVIGARVWGIPVDQTGLPYYDRVKITNWMNKYSFNPQLVKFAPTEQHNGIKSNYAVSKIPGLMEVPVRMYPIEEDNFQNVWNIYEEVRPNVPYIYSADPAEGAETPEAVGDMSAGGFMRPALEGEVKPVIVATIRSTLEVIPFGRTSSYAMRYYNNATLASETKRGSANAAFAGELRDWPYWYMHTSIQDSTGKQRQHEGFDTNAATRDIIFELIGDWLNDFDENEYPNIPDRALLKELAGAIVAVTRSGKKRCDHANDGTLDSAIWFGILLYVFKFSPEQIRCNLRTAPRSHNRRHAPPEIKAPCGMSAMGYRNPNRRPQ